MKILKTASRALVAALAFCLAINSWAQAPKTAKPAPVILDSDIGDDIDDTWALGLVLKSPELDLKLVVGDYGKADYRARLFAKFLQEAGRTNVAVGIGLDCDPRGGGGQSGWLKDYDLKSYPGKVYKDGVQAMIDLIMNSPEPITLISIGPAPNVAEALKREPRIAQKVKGVYGMYGSVRHGYNPQNPPEAEWNVKADPKACRALFTAPWELTITPLDTCGRIVLDGEWYKKVRDSKDPIANLIIQNYRVWSNNKAEERSSTLFDTVAVYLAISQDLCVMERLGLRVTDDGFTVIDDSAKKVNSANDWKNLNGYKDFLVTRLTGQK